MFNRAIADGDAGVIGSFLAHDCVMVTGTDSAVISGRMAQVKVWRQDFAQAGRLVYVPTTERIDVSGIEPIAFEQGRWRGQASGAVGPEASGTYAAKWREIAGAWVIEAEIFVTLA